MATIAELVEAGRLRAEVDTVLPFEQAAKAHELGETGRTTGKIVFTVTGCSGIARFTTPRADA
ncbi:hypothetical protein E1294_11060 [Nonomuraea diastatica]|uniref:Zinc-binding dehydrogenase n=2 Tax=Nonomuraea diastatica TaxID=1848329 RepID=A0A4R4WY97_9ACTN|nr:hypothetical protein E1294_11060 [Nonomuraea diastatica]